MIIPFLLAAGVLSCPRPALADHVGTVVGLVNLTNYQAALLVITDSPPDASFLATTHKWVGKGDEFDDLYLRGKRLHIEVGQIDFASGIVRIKENQVATFYVPQPTNLAETVTGSGIQLNQADFADVVDLYAGLKGRTLLLYPDLNQPSVSLAGPATNKLECLTILEKALRARGVLMLPDGDQFEWLVPAGKTNLLSPAALAARLPVHIPSPAPATDTLPAGSINFINVPLAQVLDVYQALTAKKLVRNGPLPAPNITFHSQTPLTKAQLLHAFDVLLAWHGLKVADVDSASFKVIPLDQGE